MFTGLIIITLVGFISVLTHRRSRLENKIYKNIPLNDWLTIVVFPLTFYLGWYSVINNIISRPLKRVISLDDLDILAMTNVFLIFAFSGNAMHFTGKILWRYLRHLQKSTAYQVNEIFHGKLSHYLIYLNVLFTIFLLAVLEFNHRLGEVVSVWSRMTIISIAIIFGLSASKAIYYTNEWFGGYNRPLFFVVLGLFLILLSVIKILGLNLSFFPVSLFVITMFSAVIVAYLTRQTLIFTRLNNRRKLRFLSRILSA